MTRMTALALVWLALAVSVLGCTTTPDHPASSSASSSGTAASSSGSPGSASSSGSSASSSGSSGSDASSSGGSTSSSTSTSSSSSSSGDGSAATFTLLSTAFTNGTRIPDRHTCSSVAGPPQHISPPLSWSDPPAGTLSFAIIVRDPQSTGGMTDNFHWAIYDIGGGVRSLTANVPAGASITMPTPARQTTSSWAPAGYFAPCPPPPTGVHNYVFVIHALNVATLPTAPTDRLQIEAAVAGASLGTATLTGTYSQ